MCLTKVLRLLGTQLTRCAPVCSSWWFMRGADAVSDAAVPMLVPMLVPIVMGRGFGVYRVMLALFGNGRVPLVFPLVFFGGFSAGVTTGGRRCGSSMPSGEVSATAATTEFWRKPRAPRVSRSAAPSKAVVSGGSVAVDLFAHRALGEGQIIDPDVVVHVLGGLEVDAFDRAWVQ